MAKTPKAPKEATRTSLFLKPEMMRSLKYISFMDEKTQTDIIEEALTEYVTKWVKKNGPVPEKA